MVICIAFLTQITCPPKSKKRFAYVHLNKDKITIKKKQICINRFDIFSL